jgi:hypothetical protein
MALIDETNMVGSFADGECAGCQKFLRFSHSFGLPNPRFSSGRLKPVCYRSAFRDPQSAFSAPGIGIKIWAHDPIWG